MKIIAFTLVLLVVVASCADKEQLKFAVWYGIKNTANDLETHRISTSTQP